MKKYIFLGGLVGFLLAVHYLVALFWDFDFTMSTYQNVACNLSLCSVSEKLTLMIGIGGGTIGISIAILLVFLIPIFVYGFLGYILALLIKRK
jgi:hypothetical protein